MHINPVKKSNRGFTLIEIMVATAIFVTATVMVTDIFVRVNNAQRKTQGIQITATDARFAFEVMAREARLGEIDYSYYPSSAVDVDGVDELALMNNENDPIRFGLRGDVCPTGTTSCLAVCLSDTCALTTDWTAITPRGVDVTNLQFFIYPDQDPFVFSGSGFNSNQQPLVTMTMTSKNVTNDATEEVTFVIQTTVSTRIYKR